MAVEGLREQKKLQTRVDVVRAAIELFQQQGYQATTVEQIVDAARYSRSTFFRYFGSKEDVLFGDAPERLAALRAELTSRRGVGKPWQCARDALTRQLLIFTDLDPQIQTDCIALWFSDPDVKGRYMEINMAWEGAIAEFFAAERGVDVNVDIPSQVIASMMAGAVRAALRAQVAGTISLADAAEEAFGLVESGLRGGETAHSRQLATLAP